MTQKFIFALLLFYSVPIAFLICYIFIYDAPISALIPHLLLIGTVFVGSAGIRILVYFSGWQISVISATMVAIQMACFIVFYGLVFLGLQFWGRVISFDLVSAYFNHPAEFLGVVGYSLWVLVAVCGGLFFILWAVAFWYVKNYDWIKPLCNLISIPGRAVIGVMLLMIAFISAWDMSSKNWGKVGEPVSLSVFPESGKTNFQDNSINNLRAYKIDEAEKSFRAAYKPVDLQNPSNVILIIVDALRADHLSLFGYPRPTSPNLISFRERGQLRISESAMSVCSESSCGIRAIGSSRYVENQANKPITLHEVLSWHGYSVKFMLSGDHKNFYGLSQFYKPYDNYFDSTTQSVRYANDDRIIIDALTELAPWNGQPAMFQFHLMSSHQAGKRLDETPEFGESENYSKFSLHRNSRELAHKAVNFYDRGVLQADHFIGSILDSLKNRGYLENALVVITGDHGESLGENDYYGHSRFVSESTLRVPFVLLGFGKANRHPIKIKGIVSQVDIAPTLLFELGIPLPQTWEGSPLQDSQGSNVVYFQQAKLIGLVDTRIDGKIYKHWSDIKTGQRFTFELLADPSESINLNNTIPETLMQEWQRLLLRRSASLEPG